jgi:hypothetical protein
VLRRLDFRRDPPEPLLSSRKGGTCDLVCVSPRPVELAYLGEAALLGLLQRSARRLVIDRQHFAIANDLLAVNKDMRHRPIGRRVDERSKRIVTGPHRGISTVCDHDVRLAPDREPPDIRAQEHERHQSSLR